MSDRQQETMDQTEQHLDNEAEELVVEELDEDEGASYIFALRT